MLKAKNAGIWMDHSNAHLTEFTTDPTHVKTISSKFTNEERQYCLNKSENLMHNKDQRLQTKYYKRLCEAIKNYQSVVIFGPAEAKTELFNILRADHNFARINIDIKDADKMTEHQQSDFVKSYFAAR